MNKKVLLLLPALALILGGCNSKVNPGSSSGSGDPGEVAVESVEVAPSELSLEVERSAILAATVKPITASNRDVTWSSDKTDVVTVDASGKVTAVGKGQATVTATADADATKKGTCVINVTEPLFKAAKTPVAEKDFRFGTYQGNLLAYIFSDGTFASYPRGNTTQTYADAKIFQLEAVPEKEGKWYVTFDVSGTKKYLGMSPNHRVGAVGTTTDKDSKIGNQQYEITMAMAEWDWDSTRYTIKQTLEQIDYDSKKVYDAGDYYAGTYGTFDTISGCFAGDKNFDSDFLFQFLTLNRASLVGPDVAFAGMTAQYQLMLPDGEEGTPAWSLTPASEKVTIDASTGLVEVAEDAEDGSKYTVNVSWGEGEDKKLSKEIEVKVVNYGTLENPLTVEEAKAVVDMKQPTAKPLFIKGVVKKNTAFDGSKWQQVWLDGESAAKGGFEGYNLKIDAENEEWSYVFQKDSSLIGLEVVITGTCTIYNSTTYETTGSNDSKLVKVQEYAHSTDLTIAPTSATVEQGASQTFTATFDENTYDAAKWSITPVGGADASKVSINQRTGKLDVATDAAVGAQYTVKGALYSNETVFKTATITIAKTSKTYLNYTTLGLSGTSYADNNGDHVFDGVTYTTAQICCKNATGDNWMQLKKAEAVLNNKTELSKAIKKITINYHECNYSNNEVYAEFGSANGTYVAAAKVTLKTVKGTLVYTVAPADNVQTYKFFKLSGFSGGAHYIDSFVIEYYE